MNAQNDRAGSTKATIDDIVENFAFFDDWEDRYRYVIDLGRELQPLPENLKTDANVVHGCQSKVWIAHKLIEGRLHFRLDSDALIVRGLIAIVLAAFNDRTPEEILAYDIDGVFARLDLIRHLSPTRGNGLAALVRRMREIAQLSTT
jgi:cysteine desulfuration protein SufE